MKYLEMLSGGHQLLYVAVMKHEQNNLHGLILAHNFRVLYPSWHRGCGEAQQAMKQAGRQEKGRRNRAPKLVSTPYTLPLARSNLPKSPAPPKITPLTGD